MDYFNIPDDCRITSCLIIPIEDTADAQTNNSSEFISLSKNDKLWEITAPTNKE